MKKFILIPSIILLFNSYSKAQNYLQIDGLDSATIVLSEKVQGTGPQGQVSYGFGSLDQMDSTYLLGFPKYEKMPASLTSIKTFCVILDDFQFHYQGYKSGAYTKEYFLDKAQGNGWNLADTILLSKDFIKTIFCAIGGIDSNNSTVYAIDQNNNYDFSDDTLRILHSNLYKQDEIISNSIYVDYEYYDNNVIKNDKIFVHATKSRRNESDLDLFFSFPEMRYGKVKNKDKIYLICQETFNSDNSIYVLEDKPYFTAVGKKYEIKPNQFINFGDEFYLYKPLSNKGSIKIIKADTSGSNFKEQIAKNENVKKLMPVSNQVGMIAPEIKGLDILNDSLISLYSNKGKYVFVDFWSTTCAPCIQEFPYMKEVYEKMDRQNFEIIGVVDDRSRGKINAFIDKHGLTWPNISMKIGSTDITGYNINSYPTTYLVDPTGKIIATNLRGSELINKLNTLKVKVQ